MVGYMNIEEQVDADFSSARRRSILRRTMARLRRDPASERPPCFEDARRRAGARGGVHRGLRVVRSDEIVGSVGRCSEFDGAFLPSRASAKERWKRIDRAFHRAEDLPPVSLYEIGGSYFVLDGNHRVSVARFHGIEWIDAVVTQFRTRSPKERRRADEYTRERRTEHAPDDEPLALEGHPRADGARRAAGGPKEARRLGARPDEGA